MLTSPLCVFVFFGKQMEKSKRDTTLSNDTWAMSWEIKGPLRTKHHILSLPTAPPFPQSDQSTPFLMQSCDQVQKSLTLLTHHWMLKSQHPVSLIISTMYQPTRDQLVTTGPRQKFSFFSNCLQNLRHFTTQQWPSLVFVFLHYFDKRIKQVHHHPLTHNRFLPTNLFTNSKGSFHRKIS